MADNAPYISGLNVSLPTNRDPRAEGAAEIRAVKTAVKNCFPELDGEVKGTAAEINQGIKSQYIVGMIMPWYGTVDNIPDGWTLCDGKTIKNTVTPDLRGRFLVGAPEDGDHGQKVGNDNPNIADTFEIAPFALKPENIPQLDVAFYRPDGTEQKMYAGQADNGNRVNNYTNEQWGANSEITFKTKGEEEAVAHKHEIVTKVVDDEALKFDNRPASMTIHWIMFVGF